jgi:hypothetical protein
MKGEIVRPEGMVASARSLQPRLRTVLLACGILAPLVYVTATLLGAARWEGYDATSQTVSELFAIGAPSKSLVDPMFFTYAALWIALGVGVWMAAAGRIGIRIAAIGLIGKEVEGLLVQSFFPMHMRGVATTTNDPLHGALTFVGVIFYLCAMAFGSGAFGRRFRIYSIATLLVCLGAAILAGLDAPRMVADEPTPWMGVFERITIFGYLLWGAVLAVGLLRTRKGSQP